MQRQLAVLIAAGLLAACRDSVPPVAPVADLVASAEHGPPPEYQPIAIQLPSEYTGGQAVAINNHNQAVISATTAADGTRRALLWDNGAIEDLGTLGAPTTTVPTDINDRGQVVGWSRENASTPAHAFFWDQGTMQDLGEVVVYSSDKPEFNQVRISDRGQVLGNRPSGQAFVWENGVTQTVSLDFAAAFNDRGQVAGWVFHDSAGVRRRHAAVWEDGVVTELGTLGGDESWARGISNSGWVVGGSRTAPNEFGSPELHAFRWRNGQMEDLGRSGQMSSGRPEGWQATLVNDPGQVGAKSNDFSFSWDHGVAQGINCRCSIWYPMDMNVHGTIVGYGGWVWRDGVLQNLEGAVQRRAVGINDKGAVVGYQSNVPTVWLPVRN